MTDQKTKALEIVKLTLKDETIYHAVCEICPSTGKHRTLKQVIEEALTEPQWQDKKSVAEHALDAARETFKEQRIKWQDEKRSLERRLSECKAALKSHDKPAEAIDLIKRAKLQVDYAREDCRDASDTVVRNRLMTGIELIDKALKIIDGGA